MKTRLVTLICVALLVALAFAARSCGIWPFNGVVVAINNSGSVDYESCVIKVTGRSYDVGKLPAGEKLKTKVWPTADSRVELDLTENDGSQHHLVVDCYFERRGYSGRITVTLGDGQIKEIADDIGIGFP